MRHRRAGSTPARSHGVSRFLRFSVVGATGAIVDFGLLNLLHGALAWPLVLANTVSVSAAILNNYSWNRHWTFGDAVRERTGPQLMRFVLVSVVGLLLNTALVVWLSALTRRWFEAPWSYNLAKAVATMIVLAWSFTASRRWTFRHPVE